VDVSVADGGTEAGCDGTAKQRSLLEGHVAPDRHRAGGWHNHIPREAADGEHHAERRVAEMDARFGGDEHGLAEMRLARAAVAAFGARSVPADRDMVADLGRRYPRSNRLDDARALVPQHNRRRARIFHIPKIGVADAGGHHLDAHLAGGRIGNGDRLEPRHLSERVEHERLGLNCAHRVPFFNSRSCRRRHA
jgi:hypothetical protein